MKPSKKMVIMSYTNASGMDKFSDLYQSIYVDGAPFSNHPQKTVGQLIDAVQEDLTGYFAEHGGELPIIGSVSFIGEDGKEYMLTLQPKIVEIP